jgi:hemerythrin-like metal-binding protein
MIKKKMKNKEGLGGKRGKKNNGDNKGGRSKKKKLIKEKLVKKSKEVKKNISSKKQIKAKSISKKVSSGIDKSFEKNIKELKWSPAISVNEGTIDNQHKKILSQISVLEEAFTQENSLALLRQTIHFLSDYIKKHLAYEEDYMKKNKYPKFAEHKKIHEGFIKAYDEFKSKFALDMAKALDAKTLTKEYAKKIHNFLGGWWLNHIKTVDKEYCRFISKGRCGSLAVKKGKIEEVAKQKPRNGKINVKGIAVEVKAEMVSKQRKPAVESLPEGELKHTTKTKSNKSYVLTGVPGFDELTGQGIPKGNLLLVAGGAGSGKTIFCMQTLINKAKEGKKCLVMSLEESEAKLLQHMEDFGWDAKKMIKKRNLKIERINPFDITRNVDALLAKQKGELLIDIDPVILPKDFAKPDFIVIDSLTAIASAFTGKDESYRIYIEQLFRFLEKTGATGFLITETEQIPKIFSPTGVEEFLADGVVVMYNIKHGNVRENALEVLKLRGAAHQKKIVAMQITGEGIMVYPEQEVFSEME